MTENKSPEQVLAEQQARQAISQQYVDPLKADPAYQDQIDRNRILSAHSGPLSSGPATRNETAPHEPSSLVPLYDSIINGIRANPARGVFTAAAIGFLAVLILRR